MVLDLQFHACHSLVSYVVQFSVMADSCLFSTIFQFCGVKVGRHANEKIHEFVERD